MWLFWLLALPGGTKWVGDECRCCYFFISEGCKTIDSTVKLYNLQTNMFIQPAKGHGLPQMCKKENENSHNHTVMNKLVRLGLHCGEGASFCHTEHWAKVYKDPCEQHCQHSSMSHLLHIESHKHSIAIKEPGMLPIFRSFSDFTRTNKRPQICSQLLYLHFKKLKKIIKVEEEASLQWNLLCDFNNKPFL